MPASDTPVVACPTCGCPVVITREYEGWPMRDSPKLTPDFQGFNPAKLVELGKWAEIYLVELLQGDSPEQPVRPNKWTEFAAIMAHLRNPT